MKDPDSLASANAVLLTATRNAMAPGLEPRILAPLGGRPLLAHLLEQISAAGLRRAVLCTGSEGPQIEACFGSRFGGLEIAYVEAPAGLGSGGELREARPLLDSPSTLVLNGASYCCIDLLDLWHWHQVQPAHATVVTATIRNAHGFGRIAADESNRVHGLLDKATVEGPGRINTGIYVLHAPLLDRIPASGALSIEQDLLPRWIDNLAVFAYPTGGAFLDIGTPESFSNADRFFISRQMHMDRLSPTPGREVVEASAMPA